MVELTKDNFDEFLTHNTDRVILFYSRNCMLCRLNTQFLNTKVDDLNIEFAVVCGNTELELVKRYNISHAPTVFVVPKGEEPIQLSNGLAGEDLLAEIKNVLHREV